MTTWRRSNGVGWLTRLWLWWQGLGDPEPMKPREYAHYRRVSELEAALREADAKAEAAASQAEAARLVLREQDERHALEIATMKTEAEFRERRYRAEVETCRHEVELLALVVERNRKRVEAETGLAATHVAEAAARNTQG